MSDGGHALLEERLGGIPGAVASACAARLPDLTGLASARRLVATGGGLSEGPARVLVALLRRAGLDARFVSQAAFAEGPERGALEDDVIEWRRDGDEPETALVLFSQGLAPNARLPLPWLGAGLARAGGARRLAPGLLVTSVMPGDARGPWSQPAAIARRLADAGHAVWTLPPVAEGDLLLRVVGPAVALVAALRVAAQLIAARGGRVSWHDRLGELPAACAAALASPAEVLAQDARADGDAIGPLAIVAEPELAELAMPLRWKLLEGLRVADPPVWDPLQVAHGPLQSFYPGRVTLVCLRSASARYDDLFARVARVVRPSDHRLIELRATLPGPLAVVELDARLDACVQRTLARHPVALDDWPSRGQDGPIYDVDPVLLEQKR